MGIAAVHHFFESCEIFSLIINSSLSQNYNLLVFILVMRLSLFFMRMPGVASMLGLVPKLRYHLCAVRG